MNEILALGVPALLCFAMADPLQCNGCFKLSQDGSCELGQHTCTAAPGESCFTRQIAVGDEILRVEQGCTHLCDDLVLSSHDYKESTRCCAGRHFCNRHNPWTQVPKEA